MARISRRRVQRDKNEKLDSDTDEEESCNSGRAHNLKRKLAIRHLEKKKASAVCEIGGFIPFLFWPYFRVLVALCEFVILLEPL
ncbi:MAG: hypothetical protein GQF41_0151 [Candidatus Rifleibacterium amylolyticum]|nr:MAG: hypothetical protein GQF41_0151 [Candidatus Rifleibacterium amylolyticum]